MKQEELVGKIQTVLGLITPDRLGVTLTHEHLLTDLSAYFVESTEASDKKMAHEPLRLENLYWVKNHALTHVDNLTLNDEDLAIKEALLFKQAGGSSIVEVSNIGLFRDPLGLQRIARATGLNIVMGAGYYLAFSHPPELATKTEEEISEQIVRDIMVGVGDTGIRAGIIGEIGCGFSSLAESERKVLRAAAIAQRRTGAPLSIHPSIPSINEGPVLEAIQILDDAGADFGRIVISHVDGFVFSPNLRRKLADRGCYLEYDHFGQPGFPPVEGHYLDMPTDLQRVNQIMELIGEGYLKQILVSQDVCLKYCLVTYGGFGYAHILRDIVPMMRSKGMSNDQIDVVLKENPKRILSFVPAKE